MGLFAEADLDVVHDYVPGLRLEATPVDLQGDVLLFTGNSYTGRSQTRRRPGPPLVHLSLRRPFLERMSAWYRPILDFEGGEVAMEENPWGGPCGTEVAIGPH
ncbi:MAG: hypothetical protein WKH64_16350 [Chloroflexia bacterium]